MCASHLFKRGVEQLAPFLCYSVFIFIDCFFLLVFVHNLPVVFRSTVKNQLKILSAREHCNNFQSISSKSEFCPVVSGYVFEFTYHPSLLIDIRGVLPFVQTHFLFIYFELLVLYKIEKIT